MKTCKDCIHCDVCTQDILATDLHPYIDFSVRDDVEESCADFKDKSKFIELPCEVGSTVYYPYAGKILEKKVTAYHRVYDARSGVQGIDWWYELDNDKSETMDADLIERTAFLTREDAEKKLEELK